MPDRVITRLAQCANRKFLVRRFEFLQANDVRQGFAHHSSSRGSRAVIPLTLNVAIFIGTHEHARTGPAEFNQRLHKDDEDGHTSGTGCPDLIKEIGAYEWEDGLQGKR
jgi:hypothetical protein